ncbi:glycoside hydrolase 5 family protein [Bacteroides ihuae]|uniref:glycoside hydrolase 5 family protein n=1 Tax=Bacteroides ihuae TaxID=1852362 RepID=UPI0008D8EF1E|nr:cellulase family glycosylhydrolase [Bacteroides ihuae]
MTKQISLLILLIALSGLCSAKQNSKTSPFVRIENGNFLWNNTPYSYIGTNFWYGAILASEGEGGNRHRLHQELDYLKKIGINNLRVLVGSDGNRGITAKVEPTLQIAPGVYNDTILAGLDYLLAEMGKRKMVAVLYLNNSWEWSGGYGQYLEWAGYGKAAVPAVDGWPAYMSYVKQYQQSDSAKALFANYVRDIITRVNRYTHLKYVDDPAIMSWQIGNEPRAFSDENKPFFAAWIADVAALIKSLDKNHLVSTGSEGKHGCEEDITLFEKIHADANVDYMNIHIWPYNWDWVTKDSLQEKVELAKENTKKYIDEHLAVAVKYNKPVVLEEFGFPRDGFQFSKESSTNVRDNYYAYVFHLIIDKTASNRLLPGCNFWGWGGFANPSTKHIYWKKGDDYTGDPAQEEQGLNSVFATDTTVDIIKTANDKLMNKEKIAQ